MRSVGAFLLVGEGDRVRWLADEVGPDAVGCVCKATKAMSGQIETELPRAKKCSASELESVELIDTCY